MKYQLTSAKPVAAKKPFDFNTAVESLTDTIDKIGSSYDALVAAEGRVAEVETVIADCQSAMESISKFGLTAQNMTLLNGADHGLDRALGLEDLAVESLASLSESTKALLQKQYTAGLEGKASEMFKNLVERVKAFFAKLIQWLKDLFTGNAQIAKIVQEVSKNGAAELDGEKKVTSYSKETVLKMIANIEAVSAQLTDLADGKEVEAKEISIPEKEAKSVKELGWDAASLKEVATKLVTATTKSSISGAWSKIQAQYKAAIAAGGEDEKKLDELKSKFKAWVAAQKATAQFSKLVRAAGMTVVTISKAGKKAAEPAPAK